MHNLRAERQVLQYPTAQEIDQCVGGQILDRVLNRRGKHRIGQARVTHDAIGARRTGRRVRPCGCTNYRTYRDRV